MDREARKPLNFRLTVALLAVLLSGYVGCYSLLVRPVEFLGNRYAHFQGGIAVECAYVPLLYIDQKLRPRYWEVPHVWPWERYSGEPPMFWPYDGGWKPLTEPRKKR